jgi:hypothetical protein
MNTVSAWDIETFEQATQWAADKTESTGVLHLPVDRGDSTSPRYTITPAPIVGEFVSEVINGDYYPDSKIVRITKAWTCITESGKRFRRVKSTACWKIEGGYTVMVAGMVEGNLDRLNPEF